MLFRLRQRVLQPDQSLIPVAGRQAVTERFEAEGDDIIQSARAVLRRIVLWRATQVPAGERVGLN